MFGIEQEEFFPGVTNRVTLQARAACGATGYSNAVSYGRDPGLPGCLEDMAVFYANLAPDGSGDLTPRSPSSGAGCPPGTSFNLYYRRPGIATVRLNAQALATPAFVIADQPAGAGHGEYWYVPLDPVTQQEGPAGPLVTSDARNSTAGPEGLPGQPARNAQYVGWDHLGSTRLVLDEEGVSLGGWKYYPFGTEAEASGPAENRKRFTGHERDTDTALDYMLARYYGPSLARFMSVDPGDDTEREIPQSWNKYTYVRNNPVNHNDPTGKWVGVDDAIFAAGGAVVGMAGQAVSDLISGKVSGWEHYAGAAIGGAAGGEALLYTGPIGAGAVGGAATNLAKQGLLNLTGKQDGFDPVSLAADTAVGAATGLIPGAKVQGVTAGRGSFNQVYKQIVTKAENGTISNVTTKTAAKMFVGRAVDTGLVPGAGAGAAAAASGVLPSSEERRPPEPKQEEEQPK
ncbi:RHS repeat-associated core domain-containing protein [Candidatus Neomicrothrix sp.]|uniref:RHS repeat-associated core domain-containing protein n=1 Tax=Candidatus Neomicrothrix sp. TaxID=2719034 RepID=UPI001B3CFB47|nr:RHS repeat-associated core domain-containing protein [Candidatus Microthrix sp.]MBP7989021.1 RHS repeat-associated core domain-containing protein [Candidatus Microthrix sp.]